MQKNYSCLLFQKPYPLNFSDQKEFVISNNIKILYGKFNDFLDCDHGYSKLLGTYWSNNLNEEKIIILNMDSDNEEDNLDGVFLTLPICSELKAYDEKAVFLSGEVINSDDCILGSPKSVGCSLQFKESFWVENGSPEIKFNTDNNVKRRKETSLSVIEQWKKIYLQLKQISIFESEKSSFLQESFRSVVESFFYTDWIEFKIPNLVRSIESIIALPKGKNGKVSFSKRTLYYLENKIESLYKAHPHFKKLNLEEHFKNIYQIRNDCVHGKITLDVIKTHPNSDPNFIYSEYEFLSEWVAKEIFKKAIFDQEIINRSTCRRDLESYWSSLEL